MPTRPLVLTDTVISLAIEARAAKEAARQAAINGAKTNMDKLIAAGVIVTCDDEMESAYRWERQSAIAKAEGVPVGVIAERERVASFERAVYGALMEAVENGETAAESGERRAAILGAAVGFMPNGKACKHRETRKERAWMVIDWRNGDAEYGCCRCGARVTVPTKRPDGPTEQAKIAAAIARADCAPGDAYWRHYANRPSNRAPDADEVSS